MLGKFISSVFGGKPLPPAEATPLEPTQKQRVLRVQDDETYLENSEFIDGLRFMATLQVRTPLSVLVHHGERFKGKPSDAPRYGTQADGCWMYALRSAEELGLKPVKREPIQASDCGLVNPGEYQPFLVDFRRIVESDRAHGSKLADLQALARRDERSTGFWILLEKAYPGFPASFFYRAFTTVEGVGMKTAAALYSAGIETTQELAAASSEILLAVPGVGKKTVAAIRAHFESTHD